MRYRVTSTLSVGPGTLLGLTKEQAVPRAYALAAKGSGQYLTTLPVQFKVGEVIGYEGDLPKGQAELVEPVKGRGKADPAAQGDLVGKDTPDTPEA